MPYVTLPNGMVAHIRMARGRPRRCSVKGCAMDSGFQCDHPMGAGKTCDAYLCGPHAYAGESGRDFHACPDHRGVRGLFTDLAP